MAREQVCPRDCIRRKVGCRSSCPDWAEHEKRKAERYAAKQLECASYPTSELKERNYRRKLKSAKG